MPECEIIKKNSNNRNTKEKHITPPIPNLFNEKGDRDLWYAN